MSDSHTSCSLSNHYVMTRIAPLIPKLQSRSASLTTLELSSSSSALLRVLRPAALIKPTHGTSEPASHTEDIPVVATVSIGDVGIDGVSGRVEQLRARWGSSSLLGVLVVSGDKAGKWGPDSDAPVEGIRAAHRSLRKFHYEDTSSKVPSRQVWAVTNPMVGADKLEKELEKALRKVDAGANCLVTQPPLLWSRFESWLNLCERRGLFKTNVPILIGMTPIYDADSFTRWLKLCGVGDQTPMDFWDAEIGDELDRWRSHHDNEKDRVASIEHFKVRHEFIRDHLNGIVSGIHVMPMKKKGHDILKDAIEKGEIGISSTY